MWKLVVAVVFLHVDVIVAFAADPMNTYAMAAEGVAALFSVAVILGLTLAGMRSFKAARETQEAQATLAWQAVAEAERVRTAQLLDDIKSLRDTLTVYKLDSEQERKARDLERNTYLAQLAAKEELIAQLKGLQK